MEGVARTGKYSYSKVRRLYKYPETPEVCVSIDITEDPPIVEWMEEHLITSDSSDDNLFDLDPIQLERQWKINKLEKEIRSCRTKQKMFIIEFNTWNDLIAASGNDEDKRKKLLEQAGKTEFEHNLLRIKIKNLRNRLINIKTEFLNYQQTKI